MIATIIIISLAFIWLSYETNWMRVRLLVGSDIPLSERWYRAFAPLFNWGYNIRDSIKDYDAYKKDWYYQKLFGIYAEPEYSWHYAPEYKVVLSPGVNGALCGGEWLAEHWHDLDDYKPTVELYFGNGYKQTFTLKKPELIGKIMHINTGKKFLKTFEAKPC